MALTKGTNGFQIMMECLIDFGQVEEKKRTLQRRDTSRGEGDRHSKQPCLNYTKDKLSWGIALTGFQDSVMLPS